MQSCSPHTSRHTGTPSALTGADGIEAIYDDMRAPIGMLKFAPAVDARGGMFSARRRLVAAGARDAIAGDEPAAVIPETD